MNPNAPETVTSAQIVTFKEQVIRTLAPETSGVLLDPIYGAAQAVCGNYLSGAALLVELEKADYALRPMPLETEILSGWSVAKIKHMGADGVKLFFYYNPDAKAFTALQDALLRRVVGECAAHDIPLYAEPIISGIGESSDIFTERFSERVIASARRIAALGADVLKMEFPLLHYSKPQGQDTCEALTNALDVPWVLLSAGVPFETFWEQVETACSAGASGYIAGRAVWGEAAQISNSDERQRWLEGTGRDRLKMLTSQVKSGRAWTSILECESVTTDWYRTYANE
jgi:tagatose 1,6-diphosphate aldolase